MPQSPDPTPARTPDARPVPDRLDLLSRAVRSLAAIGGLVLLGIVLAQVVSDDWSSMLLARPGGLQPEQMHLDNRARWLALAAQLPMLMAASAALWSVWQMFGAYRQGDIFGERPLRHLGRFAGALLAMAVLGPVQRTLVGLALTLGMPPGGRQLVIAFSSNDLFLAMIAAVIGAMAMVMRRAAVLQAENAGFV